MAQTQQHAGDRRRGLSDMDGVDSFMKLVEQKVKAKDSQGHKRKAAAEAIAKAYQEEYCQHWEEDQEKPYQGAQPLLLRHPQIASVEETEKVTAVACKTLTQLIESSSKVHIRIAHDAKQSPLARELLEGSVETTNDLKEEPFLVSLARDTWHSMAFTELPAAPPSAERLLIYIGSPSKYLSMSIKSYKGRFDDAYGEGRLVVICKGGCMLPLGSQEQNIFGIDEHEVLRTIVEVCKAKGSFAWGHGPNCKQQILSKLYGCPEGTSLPSPLNYDNDQEESAHTIDYLVDFVKYMNQVKQAKPDLPVSNYYDTGLLVSVLTGSLVDANVSLLSDRDGLAMLRESSIGHTMSKLSQLLTVKPYSEHRGVYNFFTGDGACRLNGGVEMALDLMENYKAKSMVTMFILNNHKWAIEDNLVADTFEAHRLYNQSFYDLIQRHDNIVACDNDAELRETIANLSRRAEAYARGEAKACLNIVIVRGLDVELPPVIGDTEGIRKSSEMAFLKDVLSKFSEGCGSEVPLYGCSAFEYIQYLHQFLDMPEGKKYQYICAKSDIQAGQMCGMEQPDGKAVLFINDVYGLNSLGESLRAVLSGFGGKQLLVFIWHPSLTRLIDHFHLHRPPMVWPNMGPQLAKYFVRKDADALFVDFEGEATAEKAGKQVKGAIAEGKSLMLVNMLPEQERSYVSLDIRVKTG